MARHVADGVVGARQKFLDRVFDLGSRIVHQFHAGKVLSQEVVEEDEKLLHLFDGLDAVEELGNRIIGFFLKYTYWGFMIIVMQIQILVGAFYK